MTFVWHSAPQPRNWAMYATVALYAKVASYAWLAKRATVASSATAAFCAIAPHSIETAFRVAFMMGKICLQEVERIEPSILRSFRAAMVLMDL